ncbi:MAG: 2-oxoacid:acceptor oxidoreductase family protein, partial [Ignavibacteriaceae bacterium]|nr:2-oxoacid:acceptor oxidoreductase family protein [Ignavibacteriaceae bacterium]
DIHIFKIAATEEANKLNKKQVANMIMLGAFLEVRSIVKLESVSKALLKVLPERHHHLIPLNEKAIGIGKEIIQKQYQETI